MAALLAVVAAAVLAGFLLLGGGCGGYTVKAHFQNAAQLVKRNLVQVSGQEVGKVKTIDLTSDGQAEIVMPINEDYAPLRRGTEAIVRQASLSGIASRYVDLRLPGEGAAKIPDGGVIKQDATTSAVDLDQLFDTFDDKTRADLQRVFKGSAKQISGQFDCRQSGERAAPTNGDPGCWVQNQNPFDSSKFQLNGKVQGSFPHVEADDYSSPAPAENK